MKGILGENAIAKTKTKWKYDVLRIIKQAEMEKGVPYVMCAAYTAGIAHHIIKQLNFSDSNLSS